MTSCWDKIAGNSPIYATHPFLNVYKCLLSFILLINIVNYPLKRNRWQGRLLYFQYQVMFLSAIKL